MSHQANALISTGDTVPELVAKAAAGDADAFAALYQRHYGQVHRYLLHTRRCTPQLAEDLAQDTFVRALSKIDVFVDRPKTGAFLGWLYTIARNLHTDYQRRSSTRLEALTAEMLDFDTNAASAEEAALCRMQQTETVDGLIKALRKLPPAQRQVVGFRFIEGLAIDETGRRMGKNHGAVKTLTFRALTNVRRALTEAQGAAA